VVNTSQIRQVIQAMKTAVETQIFPTRKETPKTLIFAKTDSHADDIINILRDVRSKGYYEQMKGRGVRSLDGESLKRVSNSADGAKAGFVLIDAVGVEKSLKTETRPLEKKPGVALKDLLQGVAMGSRGDDTVLSLANRLVRLGKQLDEKAQARIAKAAGGIPLAELGKGLISPTVAASRVTT